MNESMIIIFGNHEKVDTTKQSFQTTWLCKNIEFLDSFWFWISLINSNHRYIYVATYTHSYFILSQLQCFFCIVWWTFWVRWKHVSRFLPLNILSFLSDFFIYQLDFFLFWLLNVLAASMLFQNFIAISCSFSVVTLYKVKFTLRKTLLMYTKQDTWINKG